MGNPLSAISLLFSSMINHYLLHQPSCLPCSFSGWECQAYSNNGIWAISERKSPSASKLTFFFYRFSSCSTKVLAHNTVSGAGTSLFKQKRSHEIIKLFNISFRDNYSFHSFFFVTEGQENQHGRGKLTEEGRPADLEKTQWQSWRCVSRKAMGQEAWACGTLGLSGGVRHWAGRNRPQPFYSAHTTNYLFYYWYS